MRHINMHMTPFTVNRHLHLWPLFTKQTDVLPPDLIKSRSREIRVKTFSIALKIDRHLGSSASEMLVKFYNDTIIIKSNLAASRLREINGVKTSSCLVNRGPASYDGYFVPDIEAGVIFQKSLSPIPKTLHMKIKTYLDKERKCRILVK